VCGVFKSKKTIPYLLLFLLYPDGKIYPEHHSSCLKSRERNQPGPPSIYRAMEIHLQSYTHTFDPLSRRFTPSR